MEISLISSMSQILFFALQHWSLELYEYDIQYIPKGSIKS